MMTITTEGINSYQQERVILNAQIFFIKKMLDTTKDQQVTQPQNLTPVDNDVGKIVNQAV